MGTAAFDLIDYIVFIIYVLMIVGIGLNVSRLKKGIERTSQDYFLASRSLKWWAIGASLIAANISAEHFIAISGSGYRIGLWIAAYEWIAAIILIIVGKCFLPLFLDKGICTMPQFQESRYNKSVSVAFAVFWLLVYVFVNLTSVIWLGALAMDRIMGIPLMWCILGLATFSAVYSIYGGLTDAFMDLPGLAVILGAMWLTTWAIGGSISSLFKRDLQQRTFSTQKGDLYSQDI